MLYKYVALDDNKELNNKKLDCLEKFLLHSNTISYFDDEKEYTKLKFSDSEIRLELQTLFDDAKENDLICCFTSEQNNPLMWTHYANCHKGFLLTFRVINPQNFLKVIYTDEIGLCDLDGNLSNEDKDYLVNLNCIVKDKKWDVQKEYRTIIFDDIIKDSRNKCKGKEKEDYYNRCNFMYEAYGLQLEKISYGYNCKIEYIDKINEIAKNRGLPTPDKVEFDKTFNYNEKIYKKYGLKDKEINYIETKIQEMK